MFNSRRIEDHNLAQALAEVMRIMKHYDLAGAVALINDKEWAYTYNFPATWNANITDDSTPLGFRMRAREAELGSERAEELLSGTAFTFTSLKDFGTQTQVWASDLLAILKKAGLRVQYRPFNGNRLQRLSGIDMREKS